MEYSITNPVESIKTLMSDIFHIVSESRQKVATAVNAGLTSMYWHIGERINREVLGNQRAEYGKQIVATIAHQLQEELGGGEFSERSIRRMMQFASLFPDFKIVSTLSTQLSWSHFQEVIILKDEIKREFYLTMAADGHWSVRTLRDKIDGMLFERTAIATKPEELIRTELAKLRNEKAISPDLVFKSPYFLDFAGLKGMYAERDLEDALVAHLGEFLIELGNGFAFIARQKRMIIDGEDFYLDLLFFHRKLRRMIAIDLKLDKFRPQYKGQMELYLRWLERYEMQSGEEPPLGMILCSEGGDEAIELLQLDSSGIKVAQYLTELPSKEVLMRQLNKAIEQNRILNDNKPLLSE